MQLDLQKIAEAVKKDPRSDLIRCALKYFEIFHKDGALATFESVSILSDAAFDLFSSQDSVKEMEAHHFFFYLLEMDIPYAVQIVSDRLAKSDPQTKVAKDCAEDLKRITNSI